MARPADIPAIYLPPSAEARRRTRRACDKCSGLRVRCDGDYPCRRCLDYQAACTYSRAVKRRGRKPANTALTNHQAEQEQHLSPSNSQPTTSWRVDGSLLHHTSPTTSIDDQLHRALRNGSGSGTANAFVNSGPEMQTSQMDNGEETNENIPQYATTITEGGNAHNLSTSPTSLSPTSSSLSSVGTRASLRPYSTQVLGTPQSPARLSSITPRYECLEPVLPMLNGIVGSAMASTLLEHYFDESDGSVLCPGSPYVLTRVIRREALLQRHPPRPTTAAFLVTVLYVSAHTADIPSLLLPGARTRVCEDLRKIAMKLFWERDGDNHNRDSGMLRNALFDYDHTNYGRRRTLGL
jgi:xylanolytic transcriptional activator XlnR